jgi:hypothetical protein
MTDTPVPPAQKEPTLYEKWSNWIKNQKFGAVALIFAGGVTASSSLFEAADKLWTRLMSLLISDEASRTLRGSIYAFGDSREAVAGASISLDLDPPLTASTEASGTYQLTVPNTDTAKRPTLFVRAKGFAPVDYPKVALTPPIERLSIPLFRLADPGTAAASQSVSVASGFPRSPAENGTDLRYLEFDYTFDLPGLRRWNKLTDGLWIELYQDDTLSFFTVLTSESVDGCLGTVVAKSPLKRFDEANRRIVFDKNDISVQQIFIPSSNCSPRWLRFRFPPEKRWAWLQEVRNPKQ